MKRLSIVVLSIFLLVGVVHLGNNKIQAAEKYPVKPINVIFPLESGADGDIAARPLVQKASEIIGKPMVVVNKPGGGNTIGHREVYNAKPDGYTIGLAVTSIASARLLGLMPYDHHGFTPICLAMTSHPIVYASVKTQRPFTTIEEVIAFAKKNPGEVSMATTAVGGLYWTTGMVLQETLGVKFNIIPQEGSGGYVVTQVAGGHQDIGTSGFSSAKAQIEAGNLRFLVVVGERRAFGKYSYVPTLKEVGYDLSLNGFSGIFGPPKMPTDITDKLIKTFEMACSDPGVQAHFISRNFVPLFLPGQKFIEFCDREKEINRRIYAKTGLLKEK